MQRTSGGGLQTALSRQEQDTVYSGMYVCMILVGLCVMVFVHFFESVYSVSSDFGPAICFSGVESTYCCFMFQLLCVKILSNKVFTH